jgi:HEPN/Toprim N-terminal domain 1
MGSYTEFSVDGYPLVETKSYAAPEVLAVFRESDKRVYQRRLSERNRMTWGEVKPENDELETVILYQASAAKIAQRLDIMGFSLQRAQQDFEHLRREHLEEIQPEDDGLEDVWAESRAEIERLTFADFGENLCSVMRRKLRKVPFEDKDRSDVSGGERYILDYNEDYLMGFFCSDTRFLIRLACALVPPDAIVEQDLTEVVNAGYYQQEEAVCENAVRTLTEDYPANAKIIIVTEGSTDAAILREALGLLYPHLIEFYSFFDFDASRAAGGANQVVAVLKAFIAANISNKIVALFDNDTAAHEAARPLQRITLPKNVAVLHYPALESLRSYPTIGPTGTAPFDVNGLAGSIELYLGRDVLSSDHPVQWRGFSEAMRVYQGEVMHKTSLQEKFWNKAERCRSNPELMKYADWLELDLIWKSIFVAFD